MVSPITKLRAHIICGPTASGKDDLGYELGKLLNQPIIVMDSMKIYRKMDIGTDKPEKEKLNSAQYHLVNIREPHQSYDISTYLHDCDCIVKQYNQQGKTPIIAGGTFLYLKALLNGIFEAPSADNNIRLELQDTIKKHGLTYLHTQLSKIDLSAAQKIHPNDEKRIIRALEVFKITGIPISQQQQQQNKRALADYHIIPITMDREFLYNKINKRVEIMFEMGLQKEVQNILDYKGFSKEALSGVGYAQVVDFINGLYNRERMIELIQLKTRRFAKHQMTWMRNLNLQPSLRKPNINAKDYASIIMQRCIDYQKKII